MNQYDQVKLLGTRFHQQKVYEPIDYIVKAAKLKNKTTVSNVNVRAMNFACKLSWYREFLNQSDLVFCDGFGVLLGTKICGCQINTSDRMTCPDYIENLASACERENVSLFLLAGKPGIVHRAITKLKRHHGYFNKSGKENELVIQKINQFKPDVLYIGFGMPMQENWIRQNIDAIQAKVFLALGACLDFYTGAVYRGPRWMTDNGLEW